MRMLVAWSDRGVDEVSPLHRLKRQSADLGPLVRFLLHQDQYSYDKIFLLAPDNGMQRAKELALQLREYVAEVELYAVSLQDPSDYAVLFSSLAPVVEVIQREYSSRGWVLDVLLSSGTPQAQTIWVILIQSGLLSAKMFQVIPAAFVPDPHPKAIREVRFDIEGFPEIRSLRDEVVRLRAEIGIKRYGIIGESARMVYLLQRLSRISSSELPVLICGETGTGKELLAKAIHEGSERSRGPFIAENCGALAEGVLASELFGHEAGSFTGALQRRRGLFEQAHNGTIFLDEIGEAPLSVQAMLLRVLEEGVIRRVGGERWSPVDVRVVAATHRDLKTMIEQRKFREDLYYRLQGVTLELPPLRERSEDIPILIDFFCNTFSKEKRPLKLSRDALARVLSYSWPGNIRELKSEVRRWLVFCEKEVNVSDLSPELRGSLVKEPKPGKKLSTLAESVEAIERESITIAMKAHHGNLSRAAASLDIERNTLKKKLRAFGLYEALTQ